MTSWNLVAFASCVLLFAQGCGERIDQQAVFDQQVEGEWRDRWDIVPADRFFDRGGRFADVGEPGDTPLDAKHVRPLLGKLAEKHGLKWQMFVDRKKGRNAVALVAQLPSESDIPQIQATIENEQQGFPGEILHQYGHRYMSLDFLTPEDLAWEEAAEAKAKARQK
jgi:hypothetical protein